MPSSSSNSTGDKDERDHDKIILAQPHPSEALEFTTTPSFLATSSTTRKGPDLALRTLTSPTAAGAQYYEFSDFITSAISTSSAHTDYAGHDSKFGGLETPAYGSDDLFFGMEQAIPGLRAMARSTAMATEVEKQMTFMEGLRTYPKAIGWSMLLSSTLIMEGYDLTIINGFFALPEFVKEYGTRTPNGGYEVTTQWQAGLTSGAVCGEILGLFANGYLTERYGYRRCLIGALLFLCGFIFVAFFAIHIEMLMVSEVFCGLSWGVFQTLATTYAADVVPLGLRSYLTSSVNLCWLLGQFVGAGVLRGTLQWANQWSYRVPFGLQWMWAVPILIGAYFAPESPWWLIRHERYDDAKKSLYRLTSLNHKFNADETVGMMRHTNEVEKFLTSGTSYLDCFRGTDLRRTEIVCMVWATQVLCGGPMTGYATYFFVRAGLSPANAYNMNLGMYGLAIIGQLLSWYSMRYVGRRTLYIIGTALSTSVLLIGGIIGTMPPFRGKPWSLGALVILFTFIYDSTIGPVCYSLVAEIPSTRLRVKTVVLARITYNICNIVANVLQPLMLNPLAWNWKGKACFLWAGTCALCCLWCWFRLPEPKGLTYIELDILFQKKVATRKFKAVQVNLEQKGYFDICSPVASEDRWRGSSVAG